MSRWLEMGTNRAHRWTTEAAVGERGGIAPCDGVGAPVAMAAALLLGEVNWSPPKRPALTDTRPWRPLGRGEGKAPSVSAPPPSRRPPHCRWDFRGFDGANALRFLPFSRTVRRAFPRPCSAVVGRPVRSSARVSHPLRHTNVASKAGTTARSISSENRGHRQCQQAISDSLN
jgi:hypothetical protein